MKTRLLLMGILSFTLILSACGNPESEQPEDNITNVEQQTFLANQEETPMNCKQAIQKYLQKADLQGSGEAVKAGDNITVDYIGRLDEETVFDTSVESVAKACGSYNGARDYSEGLTFDVGAGQMIAGFDAGVVGMKIWQTKTVSFGPEEGYGPVNEERIVTFPLSDIPNADDYPEGAKVYLDYGMAATITKKTNKEITLDMNHELAGKSLTFDITIKSIN